MIVDLQSQNGTYLNGERIEHAEIPHDGEVSIGTYRLRLASGGANERGSDRRLAAVDGRLRPSTRPSHPNQR